MMARIHITKTSCTCALRFLLYTLHSKNPQGYIALASGCPYPADQPHHCSNGITYSKLTDNHLIPTHWAPSITWAVTANWAPVQTEPKAPIFLKKCHAYFSCNLLWRGFLWFYGRPAWRGTLEKLVSALEVTTEEGLPERWQKPAAVPVFVQS